MRPCNPKNEVLILALRGRITSRLHEVQLYNWITNPLAADSYTGSDGFFELYGHDPNLIELCATVKEFQRGETGSARSHDQPTGICLSEETPRLNV